VSTDAETLNEAFKANAVLLIKLFTVFTTLLTVSLNWLPPVVTASENAINDASTFFGNTLIIFCVAVRPAINKFAEFCIVDLAPVVSSVARFVVPSIAAVITSANKLKGTGVGVIGYENIKKKIFTSFFSFKQWKTYLHQQ